MSNNGSDDVGKTARETGVDAITTVIALGGGPGTALAAVALKPVFLHMLERSWAELKEARQRSAGVMVQSASETLGHDPHELEQAAFSSQGKTQLFAEAVQAAAATFDESKIQALGRALANGLEGDEATVDEERLLVAGLAGLEEPHVRVLINLPRQRPRPMSTPSSSSLGTGRRRGAPLTAIADRSGLSPAGAMSVIAELVHSGMAQQDGFGSEQRHDRLILDLQAEVAKLQWLLDNPGKRPPSSKKPKTLKKPGRLVDPGYGRTRFGDRCIEYLRGSVPDAEYDEVFTDQDPDETAFVNEVDVD